jgi:ferredoxin
MADFSERYPDNAPGKYYVDNTCLDCAACRENAPTLFARNDAGGYYYVSRQPRSPEEFLQARDALEGCPCESIGDDGDLHDWSIPTNASASEGSPGREKRSCPHCAGHDTKRADRPPDQVFPRVNHSVPKKPWWKFW